MSKKTCRAGSKWDGQLQTCVPLNIRIKPPTAAEPSLTPLAWMKNTPPTDQTEVVFNPALWVLVLLAALASILALVLWLLIYKRHLRQLSEEDPEEQTLHKTDPLVTVHCPLPTEASPVGQQHLHSRPSTAPVWPGGSYREHVGYDGGDWCGGLKGTAVRQETVPLPATELGGTALVTTKTL